jgi:hypothetical protein
MNCFSTTRQVAVQGRPAQNAQAPVDDQQLAVVPAPAAPANNARPARTTWQWIKDNWKPALFTTGVLTVGAVCAYLAWEPDPLPPTFPGSNCLALANNATNAQQCYTLTVHNCGKCLGNIPSQTRCAANNSIPQINPIALKAVCESPDFQACLEGVPCSSSAQPDCIADNFSQHLTYLNQTCTLKEKTAKINRFHRRLKRLKNREN